jgi:hypothetical protein
MTVATKRESADVCVYVCVYIDPRVEEEKEEEEGVFFRTY